MLANSLVSAVAGASSESLKEADSAGLTRLQFVAGLAGLLSVPSALAANKKAFGTVWRKVSLTVGATRPFKALHVSDTHLTVLTESEKSASAWRRKYYEERFARSFAPAEEALVKTVGRTQAEDFVLLHTGDLVDCPSDGNVEIVRRLLPPGSVVAAVGNHETCSRYFRGKDNSPAALAAERERSEGRLASCWPNDPRWFVRDVNGVRFVAFDNTDYQVSPDIRVRLEKTFGDDCPIVLLCHVPFYTSALMKRSLTRWKSPSLMGVPDEVSGAANRTFSFPEEQRPTALTLDTLAWLKRQKNLKAILCGHLHVPWQGEFAPGVPLLVAEAHFMGGGYEISFS